MVEDLRERVAEWARKSVADGLTGLASLGEEEFDGVVDGGGVSATFVSGRVLHTDGELEALEETPLTARQAPEPELPLFLAMRATGGESQAQYYSEDTPIDSVDERLQSGGFTGYLELAENVLSGSYYRLYYGGTARSLAFVGTDDRVVTGTDAYDRTLEEVGIYEVVPVELSVTDVPEPPEPAGDDPGEPSPTNASEDDTTASATADGDGTTASADAGTGESSEGNSARKDADDEDSDPTASSMPAPDGDAAGGPAAAGGDTDTTAGGEASGASGPGVSAAGSTAPDVSGSPEPGDDTSGADAQQSAVATEGSSQTDRPAEEDTDTTSAPSGEPDTSSAPAEDPSTASEAHGGPAATETAEEPAATEARGDDATTETPGEAAVGGDAVDDQRLEALFERLSDIERRVAALESDDETAEQPSSGPEQTATESCSPTAALEATDYLVRYETRAGATVERLLDGEATADAVRENLRIEINTTLEAATVDGVPYEDFLADSLERRVVGWLLCELPAEIVVTDARGALGDLVEALPALDRIGFQETLDLEALGEEPLDEEAPATVGFDLVAWDTDGHPRVVADLSRSSDPVGEGPVSSLIARAKSVASQTDLAAALFATEGYVEADARRAVEATTGGGILARDSRASYVKMTRNRGFHCCLAEAYDESIHLTVPEL